jgi:hypothetical protein
MGFWDTGNRGVMLLCAGIGTPPTLGDPTGLMNGHEVGGDVHWSSLVELVGDQAEDRELQDHDNGYYWGMHEGGEYDVMVNVWCPGEPVDVVSDNSLEKWTPRTPTDQFSPVLRQDRAPGESREQEVLGCLLDD